MKRLESEIKIPGSGLGAGTVATDLTDPEKLAGIGYTPEEVAAMVEQAASNITQAQRLDRLRREVAFDNAKKRIIHGGL